MFSWFFPKRPEVDERAEWLNLRIRWVTEGALIPDQQASRAGVVAAQLSSSDLDLVPALFRREFSAPAHLKENFSEFCSWADARFESIFLVLGEVGAPAVPVLRRIALGEYDWQQGMAVDVLGELASQGVEVEAIARMVSTELKFWRYETVMRGIHGAAKLAAVNERVADALLALATEWGGHDPIEALEILEPLSMFAPQVAARREDWLYDIMLHKGRGVPRSAFQEGFVVDLKGEILGEEPELGGLTEDFHAIRAAVALHRIHPAREEVRSQLRHWRDNHSHPSVRQELKALLSDL